MPFAFGKEFIELPAETAASYCFDQNSRRGAVGQMPILGAGPLGLFARAHVGWHWVCDPTPSDERRELVMKAATVVTKAAGTGTSKTAVLRLMLPWGSIAPGAWIEGGGAFNVTALRFFSLRVLRQLTRTPGISAAELARQTGILDECEVNLVLGVFTEAGVLESSPALSLEHLAQGGASTLENGIAPQHPTPAYFVKPEVLHL